MKNKKGFIFIGMGFELGAVVIGSLFLGQKLDEILNTNGLMTAVLSMSVTAGWLYHLTILIKKYRQDET